MAVRVRTLLTPARGGWSLPPSADDAHQPDDPAAVAPPATGALLEGPPTDVASALPRPAATPTAVVPADVVVPTVLERLRAGRLDPGRRAVVGLALLGLLACLLAGALVLRGRPQEVGVPVVERPGTPIAGASLPSAEPAAVEVEVVVAVAGRVRKPGLVRLPPGSRVDDAVRAAGGLLPGASVGLLNLARKVVDGEQVLVGVEAPPGAAAPAAAAPGASTPGARTDLNTASASDLDALPGIGPVLAQRIVDHRTQHGPFRSVDQLREVSGIGEAKYATLRDRVAV